MMLLDVQYLVANSHLLQVGPTDGTMQNRAGAFNMPTCALRRTNAHVCAIVNMFNMVR